MVGFEEFIDGIHHDISNVDIEVLKDAWNFQKFIEYVGGTFERNLTNNTWLITDAYWYGEPVDIYEGLGSFLVTDNNNMYVECDTLLDLYDYFGYNNKYGGMI